jgi:hypothetical protein
MNCDIIKYEIKSYERVKTKDIIPSCSSFIWFRVKGYFIFLHKMINCLGRSPCKLSSEPSKINYSWAGRNPSLALAGFPLGEWHFDISHNLYRCHMLSHNHVWWMRDRSHPPSFYYVKWKFQVASCSERRAKVREALFILVWQRSRAITCRSYYVPGNPRTHTTCSIHLILTRVQLDRKCYCSLTNGITKFREVHSGPTKFWSFFLSD